MFALKWKAQKLLSINHAGNIMTRAQGLSNWAAHYNYDNNDGDSDNDADDNVDGDVNRKKKK